MEIYRSYSTWLSCTFALVTFVVFVTSTDVSDTIVEVSSGTLQGSILTSTNGRSFLAFKGIPYAKPPIRSLRFMPPQPSEEWKGIRNATEEGNICPQIHIPTGEVVGDEDCLFLNVYTPKIPKAKSEDRLPVMVWIHGGLFSEGSGNADCYGPDYFLDEDIILVTLNYRLGALGFLSTGNLVSPGNNGLKDQVLALKWVKDNIQSFGGDSRRVTIFGNDAGAASVHYHILSPMSKGLFHRAISQSGSALNPWAFTVEGPMLAYNLAELISCDSDGESANIMRCLRGHPAERIVRTTLSMKEWGTIFFNPFKPVAEGKTKDAFISNDPMKMMKDGKLNKVKYIIGINSHEGILHSSSLLNHPSLSSDITSQFHRYLPMYLGYDSSTDKGKEIVAKIIDFYFQNKTLHSSLYPKFYEMDMDQKFLFGIHKTAKMLNQGTFPKIYFYHVSYDGGISYPTAELKKDVKGVNHGEEMAYMFKATHIAIDLKSNINHRKTSERFIKMWTNFAIEGNPTPQITELLNTNWEPFSMKTKSHLDIGNELKMKEDLYNERMEFWESLESIFLRKDEVKDEL